MKKFTIIFGIFILSQLSSAILFAQVRSDVWNQISEESITTPRWEVNSMPLNYNTFSLDFDNLFSRLQNAPDRKLANSVSGIVVTFPLVNGGFEEFEVYDAPVLENQLQSEVQSARSFIGKSLNNKHKTIRFSMSIMGLKGLMFDAEEGTQYIDCLTKDRQFYMMYFKKDVNPLENQIVCLTEEQEFTDSIINSDENESFNRHVDDGVLREFRLALACTEEFSNYYLLQLGLLSAPDPVKKDAILNVMNDIMTRVNAVYENELSLTMTIVSNNSNVIFLEDTFLSNNDITSLINQSQTFIDLFVGANNYDIGHMLSTSGSGLAQLFSPCTSNKARAVTGGLSSIPQGVVFENTLLHEMGHQYGAFHTYNANNCAGPVTPGSAYEPGGGTTIMSYAGICGSNSNIQPVADDYFHQNSINEMWLNLTIGNSTCASQTATNNSEPTAEAGNDYTIPVGTPYKLIGIGSDVDGQGALTYTWEQFDLGPSIPVPSNITENGPIVRSFPPSTNSTRYIPRLQDYVNNVNSSTGWEKLVLVSREINYSFTVRDNDITGGQIGVDFMKVTTDNSAGPFRVTSQAAPGTVYEGNSMQTITWNVSNTNSAPINATNVNILLSTDGGLNFDTVLLANTPNDGSEDVILANVNSTTCRIMVEAVDNIFYNINTRNFEIEESLSIDDQVLENSLSIYPNPNNGEFNIKLNSNLNDSVTINVYDIRGRTVFENIYKKQAAEFNEVIKLNEVQSGVYLLEISVGENRVTKKIVIN
ncbi:M12 family metallo-peptidase [Psychroserpens mesophilus]|uniref:zinc-dependent metalloprotease n=1 Tax=Psychroserpens mesophilus TaxID=325473 RepID=UPI003D655A7B